MKDWIILGVVIAIILWLIIMPYIADPSSDWVNDMDKAVDDEEEV